MDETRIERCPECFYPKSLINYRHSRICSLIDFESAKFYIKIISDRERRNLKRAISSEGKAKLWEDKYNALKNEYNKLLTNETE